MIITVTMNPAIDKTVDVTAFVHGGLNRITNITRDAGGKGINVSKTIHQLGGFSIATGFLAGGTGAFIEQFLKDYGIQTDFIHIAGETRTNTKIVEQDGTLTELNEAGPAITDEEISALIQKLESYASEDTLVILAGSVPAGTDKTIYRTIIEKMHAKGASVLLDADGELFVHALEAGPDIIKPNRFELMQYFESHEGEDHKSAVPAASESKTDSLSGTAQTENTDPAGNTGSLSNTAPTENVTSELLALGQKLLHRGIKTIAISMGAEGAIFLNKEEQLLCPGLSVKAHSAVGAGDAMVAALAYSWEQKLPLRDCAILGMAVSAGAVTTTGTKPPSAEVINTLMKEVVVRNLN